VLGLRATALLRAAAGDGASRIDGQRRDKRRRRDFGSLAESLMSAAIAPFTPASAP